MTQLAIFERGVRDIVRALTNVGMELRNLSFAVSTPPVPEWFQPPHKSPMPVNPFAPHRRPPPGANKGELAAFERYVAEHQLWEATNEVERLSAWPSFWINKQRDRLIAEQTSRKEGRGQDGN